ncbi:acetoin utilization protein AcuC [Brevibacterium litoralis]|uniref:acetoin utilization protein AcuC n=1 Tax=Brevibacterium litoralis TaxID=3138935 RepID=UPI0032F024DE
MTSRERVAEPTDVYVVWEPTFTEYDFGPGHPMHPLRLDLTAALATEFGVFDNSRVHVHGVGEAEEDTLLALHDEAFVDAVKKAGERTSVDAITTATYGLGTDEVPRFDRIHEASARIYQGSVDAARAIISGRYDRAVNFCGGMHHAMPAKAGGFCVYNDAAGAIQQFLDAGYQRVVYIDLDAHHGDGTETFFWDDPRVLTVSIHENGRFLYPGTGFPNDIGGLKAAASAVNIPMPPRARDEDWLRALDAVLPKVLREFNPQVIVSQHGCDGHREDPLTHLRLSIDAMRVASTWIRDLSEELCDGRWLATGGGGYAVVDVVPRVWSSLVGISAGLDIGPWEPTPPEWQHYVRQKTGRPAPEIMTDGYEGEYKPWTEGFDPESDLDRAVMAVRKNVFPFYGLDPYFD